jgi:hypothetical protein
LPAALYWICFRPLRTPSIEILPTGTATNLSRPPEPDFPPPDFPPDFPDDRRPHPNSPKTKGDVHDRNP